MPAFSIFSPTSEPIGPLGSDRSSSPVLAIDAAMSSIAAELPGASIETPLNAQLVPNVLLRLPDLAVATQSVGGRRSIVADVIYWTIILAGSAIAIWLIWQGEGAAGVPNEDGLPRAGQEVHGSDMRAPLNTNETGPQTPENPAVLYTADRTELWPAIAPDPAVTGGSDTQPSESATRPGEAAPLGTILTPPVQP